MVRPWSETNPEEYAEYMRQEDEDCARYVKNGVKGNEYRLTENPTWIHKGKSRSVQIYCDHCKYTTYSMSELNWWPLLHPALKLHIDDFGEGYVYRRKPCEQCGCDTVRVEYWGERARLYVYWCNRHLPYPECNK